MANKDINRIKVILVEKKKTAKWLTDELGKDPATVSKWCTNVSQPSLDTLVDVSKALEVDVRELLTKVSHPSLNSLKRGGLSFKLHVLSVLTFV